MLKLIKLRQERAFNTDIEAIVNVLKVVASSEFYHLQKVRKNLDEFGDYLKGFFEMVDITGVRHQFLEKPSLTGAVILITSDAGFLGKLNVTIVDTAMEQCINHDKLIIVGEQGARYVKDTGKDFIGFPGISDKVEYEEVERLVDFVIKGFLGKQLGRTIIVYPHFVSFAVWDVRIYQLLPCRFLFSAGVPDAEWEKEVIIEPSINKIIEYSVKIWMNYILYGIFWESKLAEWSTRVMHLEESSHKIKKMTKKLRLQYFRLLHEISDKNIREILGSQLAEKRISY